MNDDGRRKPNGLNWMSELDGTKHQTKVDGRNYDNDSATKQSVFASSTTMVCKREERFLFF